MVANGAKISRHGTKSMHGGKLVCWTPAKAKPKDRLMWSAGDSRRLSIGASDRGPQFIFGHNMSQWTSMHPRKLCVPDQRLFDFMLSWPQREAVQNSNTTTNKQSGDVPVATDDAVHVPTGALQFEDSITNKCHEECRLDDTVDSDPSFMTICGAAVSSSVAVSHVQETSCRKVTCDVPPDASFCRVFREAEVSSQDVVTYTCQASKTATDLMGESGTFGRSYESGDLAVVGSGAESCQHVSCNTISPSDTHHGTIPTSDHLGHIFTRHLHPEPEITNNNNDTPAFTWIKTA